MLTLLDPTLPWHPRHAVFDPRAGAMRLDLGAPLSCIAPGIEEVLVGTQDGRILGIDERGAQRDIGRCEGAITALQVTADDDIVSVSFDQTLRCWGQDGELTRLSGLGRGLVDVAVLRDGRWVTPMGDGQAKVWDPVHGSVEDLSGHVSAVTALAVVPGGNRVLTGSKDSTLILWDLDEGTGTQLYGHVDTVTSLTVGASGIAVSTSNDGTAKLWNLDTGKVLEALRGHEGPVLCSAIDLGGRFVATGGADGVIRLWDTQGNALGAYWGHRGPVTGVVFSPDGSSVWSTSRDRTLRRWNLRDLTSLYEAPCRHPQGVRGVAWDPNGVWVASGGRDGIVALWDVVTGQRLARMTGHEGGVNAVASTASGQLASVGNGGQLRLWDADARRCRLTVSAHDAPATTVCFLGEHTVVTGARDQLIRGWNPRDGSLRFELSGHTQRVRALTPFGEQLASGSYDGTVRLWNADGSCAKVLEGHTEPVVTLAAGHDWLASGSTDRTVRVWMRGRCVHIFDDHDLPVTALATLTDGTLMSATSAGTLRTWDPYTGRQLAQHHFGAPFDGLTASEHGLVAGDRWGNVWFLYR